MSFWIHQVLLSVDVILKKNIRYADDTINSKCSRKTEKEITIKQDSLSCFHRLAINYKKLKSTLTSKRGECQLHNGGVKIFKKKMHIFNNLSSEITVGVDCNTEVRSNIGLAN